jgi:hypothetical protein
LSCHTAGRLLTHLLLESRDTTRERHNSISKLLPVAVSVVQLPRRPEGGLLSDFVVLTDLGVRSVGDVPWPLLWCRWR